MKAAQDGTRTTAESKFYCEVAKLKVLSRTHRELSAFMPQFFGIQFIKGARYIVLEDLTAIYSRPSVLDLKMGTKTHQTGATAARIAHKRKKFPLQDVYGWRAVGMRVWQVHGPDAGDYKVYNKTYGKAQSRSEMDRGQPLIDFVSNGKRLRAEILLQILQQVLRILAWFKHQRAYVFRSTSLLLIYEGDMRFDSQSKVPVTVKMIDFVYTQPLESAAQDESYIVGLHDLVSKLQALAASSVDE